MCQNYHQRQAEEKTWGSLIGRWLHLFIFKSLFGISLISNFWLQSTLAETWSDDSGKFEIEADFVGVTDQHVLLRKTSGVTIKVPINRLSVASLTLARKLHEVNKVEPAGPSAGSEVGASDEKTLSVVDAGDFTFVIHSVTKGERPKAGEQTAERHKGTTSITVDLSCENRTAKVTRILATSIRIIDSLGRIIPSRDQVESFSPPNMQRRMQVGVNVMMMSASRVSEKEDGAKGGGGLHGSESFDPKSYDQDEEDSVLRAIKLLPGTPVRREVTFYVPDDTVGGPLFIDIPCRGRGTQVEETTQELMQTRLKLKESSDEMKSMVKNLVANRGLRPGYTPKVLNESVRIVVQKSEPGSYKSAHLGELIETEQLRWQINGFEQVDKLPTGNRTASENATIVKVEYTLENLTNKTFDAKPDLQLRHDADGRTFEAVKSLMIEATPQLVPGIRKTLTAYFPVPSALAEGPLSVGIAERQIPQLNFGVEVALRESAGELPRTIYAVFDTNRQAAGLGIGNNLASGSPKTAGAGSWAPKSPLKLLGDRFRFNDHAYTFQEIEKTEKLARKTAPQGTVFVIVNCTIENLKGYTDSIYGLDFKEFTLLGSDGAEFKVDESLQRDVQVGLQETHPNVPITGRLPFIVPKKFVSGPLTLRLFKPGFLGRKNLTIEVDLTQRTKAAVDAVATEVSEQVGPGRHANPASKVLGEEIGLGKKFVVEGFAYTFKQYRVSDTLERRYGPPATLPGGGKFIIVEFEASNQTDEKVRLAAEMKLVDHQGRIFEMSRYTQINDTFKSFEAGQTTILKVGFVVAAETPQDGVVLQLQHVQWQSGKSVSLAEDPPEIRIRLK